MGTAEAHFSAVKVAEAHFSAVKVAEAHFSAMGSTGHVLVVVGDAGHRDAGLSDRLLGHALRRVGELQSRWSRFEPDSEISRLNRQRHLTHLSADTMALLRAARTAWSATDGLFDPTMAGVMNQLGYDRDFRELMSAVDSPIGRPMMSRAMGEFLAAGMEHLVLDEERASAALPVGAQFDPGGIGKGLAADIVCRELLDMGACGALVNLGGDVRVMGDPPPPADDASPMADDHSAAWLIDIEDPLLAHGGSRCLARATVLDGAVASSSTLRRRWSHAGSVAHHLLDPRTGAPAQNDMVASTVVAAEAWWAEALTKALLLGGSPELLRGAAAFVVRADGSVGLLGDHERFLVVDRVG